MLTHVFANLTVVNIAHFVFCQKKWTIFCFVRKHWPFFVLSENMDHFLFCHKKMDRFVFCQKTWTILCLSEKMDRFLFCQKIWTVLCFVRKNGPIWCTHDASVILCNTCVCEYTAFTSGPKYVSMPKIQFTCVWF